MNENEMQEILKELSKPFHPAHVTWKPGVFNRDKTKALALAYADLRAYQNRLDELCGMNWSVSYTPWGERIVCHLTINGVTRSSTGEPDSQSERSEIAGTTAEAQAFKRACAMFGLGRYLYNLPSVWAEFDNERRQFTDQGKARLNGIIVQHYRRHVDPDAELGELNQVKEESPVLAEVKEAVVEVIPAPAPAASNGQSNGKAARTNGAGNKARPTAAAAQEAVAEKEPATPKAATVQEAGAVQEEASQETVELDEEMKKLHTEFNKLGQELYGEQWEQVRRHNVERISGGSFNNSEALDAEALKKLIAGLKKLKRQRKAA
jgi:hypothetical protein